MNDYIEIGHIVNTFGLKGELKITSSSDFIDYRFQVGKTIYIKFGKNYESHKVSSMRMLKGNVIITIDELYDINKINGYIGAYIYALKSDVPPLEAGEYLIDDLVGKVVKSVDGAYHGILTDVIILPGHNALEITLDNGEVKLIPFVKEFIVEIADEITLKFLENCDD